MRRSRGANRTLRPIALDVFVPVADDLTTWTSSATIKTMALPGDAQAHYPLLVDVTNVIHPAAAADTGALRFRHRNGVTMGHARTASGRILLGGEFHGGVNQIDVYWGKAGATQPGAGFPSAADVLAPYRLALIFENDGPIDLSPDPATWTIVGTPTFTADGLLGKAMTCAPGSYIETTAAKLRGNARDHRSAFVVFRLKTAAAEGRLLCWANWPINQRAFQLWVGSELEVYASDNGTSFQRWRYPYPAEAGWNAAGCALTAGQTDALVLLNSAADTTGVGFVDAGPTGQLFNSTDPYIVGGTKVDGAHLDGDINCAFELKDAFRSPEHLLVWSAAWLQNAVFWGATDRTPDNFDVPDLTGVPLSTEVSFAGKQITGISADTPISVAGDGNPTYSIGSAFNTPADIKAKGATTGLIDHGNWLFTQHTSSAQNSTVTESNVTIGTVTSRRKSTTVAAASGGSGTPDGPANIVVTSLSALVSAFNSAPPGYVIELAPGDYKPQGKLTLQNKDMRGKEPVWVRAGTRGFRGFLPSEGGLMVSGETYFRSGSGGAEVSGIYFKNIHNIGFDGLRVHVGRADNTKNYAADIISCTNLTFQYTKWCGWRPDATFANGAYVNEDTWTPEYKTNDPWGQQSQGLQLGVAGPCDRITFKKSLFHYFREKQLYLGAASNALIEDCVFTDSQSDHMRTDGGQDNLMVRRCIFYRTWATQGSPGGGLAHCDDVQNTVKTQPGWRNHRFEMCIFSPGDAIYPHIQGTFYECDYPNDYPIGDGFYVTDCHFETRARNAIVAHPANRTFVTRTTILQQQYGGRENNRDLTFNTPQIILSSSKGNNRVERCVLPAVTQGSGDQVVDCTMLNSSGYGTHFVNYPAYASNAWHQVKILNPYTCVLDVNELKKWSPKTSSSLHPNQKGYHYGSSALLEYYGALA